jgi:hypothetical protein
MVMATFKICREGIASDFPAGQIISRLKKQGPRAGVLPSVPKVLGFIPSTTKKKKCQSVLPFVFLTSQVSLSRSPPPRTPLSSFIKRGVIIIVLIYGIDMRIFVKHIELCLIATVMFLLAINFIKFNRIGIIVNHFPTSTEIREL